MGGGDCFFEDWLVCTAPLALEEQGSRREEL